jgi:alkylated DNA nucleotide flippase Atl1
MSNQESVVDVTGLTHYERTRLLADARLSKQMAAAYDEHSRTLLAALEGEVVPDEFTVRGKVQKRVFGLPGMYTERGMSAGEIAGELEYDEANAYTVLDALSKAGHVELVERFTPRRYRMTVKHRRDRILRLSRVVPEGRWTTYGDFSIAVYDNWRMAITVGRVASRSPAFINAHRVIWAGGVVKDVWKDDQGGGRDQCIARLAREGVTFPDGAHADEKLFVPWQELKQLLEADEAGDQLDEAA